MKDLLLYSTIIFMSTLSHFAKTKKRWFNKKKNFTLIIKNNAIKEKKKFAANNVSRIIYYNYKKKLLYK